jgi:hypothetical protein
LAAEQGRDVNEVLAGARLALGGEKLAALRTLAGSGRTLRTGPNGNTTENEFELALELPDKYRLRTALAALGNMSIYRNSGFNGGQVIEDIDRPPNLSGGHVVIRVAGPGGSSTDAEKMTPEQKAEADRLRLLANKKEFARLTLGLFAASLTAFPLEFAYAGQAESADGRADVVDVKGEGGFAVRLFLDVATHLPLMVSWMDKEPIILQMGPGGASVGGGGTTTVVRSIQGGGSGAPGGPPAKMTKEEMEKLQKDLDARRAEAEAKRRTVEFRIYYSDYQSVGGVQLPHRIQRAIDGKTTEELIFDSFKVNGKIDAGIFEPAK